MKKFMVLMLAVCLIMAIGASASFATAPDYKAAHPNFSDSHKIFAYVEPFAKITWGDVNAAYLQGDGTPGYGSIGVKVEANTRICVQVAGDGFKSTEKHYTDNGHTMKWFYLDSAFGFDGRRYFGTPSFIMDDTTRNFTVFYKATPKAPPVGQGVIEATHAGWYEGNVTITITNVSGQGVLGPHTAGQL